jgi:hypothetical protein
VTIHQSQPRTFAGDDAPTQAFEVPQQRGRHGAARPAPFVAQAPAVHQPTPKPPKKRRRGLWVVGAIVALFVIIVAVSSGGGSTTAPTSATPAQGTVSGVQSAAPAAAPVTPPKVYTGKGDDVVKIDKPAGAAIVTFTCAKCSGNTIVQSNGADSLLVNTIGSYSGKKAIDVMSGSTTSQLTIKATGSWKVTVGGLDQATQASGTAPISGKGDDVIELAGNSTTAAITNHGDANFIVQDTPTDGGFPDLAVNTIGSYTGTVPLAAPTLVQVTSDGTWSITPQS